MPDLFFSVVIPLYNKEKHIQRAIKSVLAQTVQDFELIIVDDGSTDGSYEAANKIYDPRIRFIRQENRGVSAARNRGVSEAKYDWVAFLDADDEWLPEFLETMLKLQSQFPEASAYSSLYSRAEKSGKLTTPDVSRFFPRGYQGYIENFLNIIRTVLPFNMSSFVVRKEAFQSVGGFPLGVKYGEDVDLFIRISLIYKIAYANDSLVIYHQEAENRACDLYYPSLNEYYPVIDLINMKKRAEIPDHFEQSANEYVAKHQLSLARSYLSIGNPQRARELIVSCFGTKIYLRKWLFLYFCSFLPASILKSIIHFRKILSNRS